jgi:protocatechuate 3,4-dioxygenase beta subunit
MSFLVNSGEPAGVLHNELLPKGNQEMKTRIAKVVMLLAVVAFMSTWIPYPVEASGPPPTPPPPANVSSVGVIGGANEPGERIVVSGQVFAPDGTTPVGGVIVYAYQTDATGHYQNDPQTRVARLHGWAKTDAQGRYEFRTIRPAAYPSRDIAAHIHFHVWGAGYPLQWTPELMFAGDPLLKPDQIRESTGLGKFANVQPLVSNSDGALHCTFNIRISAVTNYS